MVSIQSHTLHVSLKQIKQEFHISCRIVKIQLDQSVAWVFPYVFTQVKHMGTPPPRQLEVRHEAFSFDQTRQCKVRKAFSQIIPVADGVDPVSNGPKNEQEGRIRNDLV
jgi:hypothetical protein